MSIRSFYDKWAQYNDRITRVIAPLAEERLALVPSATDQLPVWAIVGHTAAMRVYWLCVVAREPGADTTPFADSEGADWADDLDHPRTASELVGAMETTFAIIDGVLDRWTPAMLSETVERKYADTTQIHTRASILQRMMTHEAWHAAQLSLLFAAHHLPQIDLWAPESHLQS
jgi:uncharacterized damage-inducible protein DinB